jgi:hypothetical protein
MLITARAAEVIPNGSSAPLFVIPNRSGEPFADLTDRSQGELTFEP